MASSSAHGGIRSPSATSAADAPEPPIAQQMAMSLDRPDFRSVDFINQIFPTEASLVAIDPLIQRLRDKIRLVDAEIIQAIRQQSSCGSRAREDLAASMKAIQELSSKMQEIRSKAEQSEVMVQEICRDIKKLDCAKKHITATITALNRLAMLVLAVDRLHALTANRQYRDAAGQLQAVTQLLGHFEAYHDVPKILDLREKVESLRTTLKSHIFSDFSSLGSASLKEDSAVLQQLADACLVVDALDPSVREELIRNVCSRELTAYQQIFQGTDVARLEKAERRYSWIKRQMKSNEEIWRIFPPAWRVTYLLCLQFCKITRVQLMEVLDNSKEKPDVATILQALERTLEFEEDLAKKFGEGEGGAKEGGEGGTASGQEEADSSKGGLAMAAAMQFSFRGAISSAFEPHLQVYVELEERTLQDALEKLIIDETWEAEEHSQTNILRSSTEMFLFIRKSFNRCCQLTKGQTLFSLFRVFQKVLRLYAARLNSRIQKAGPGSGSDWPSKMNEREERVICYVVNTAEYCSDTTLQLAESIQNRIESQFVERVDVTEDQDEFQFVVTRALSVLVAGSEAKLDVELERMTRMAWGTMESVGDQSEFVNNISSIFSNSVPMIAALLSPVYFQFFLDKMAASFAPRYFAAIFKSRRISGTGAQQMLLDTHALKTILMELPALGGQTATVAYSKYVAREMGRAEALLKVILSPVENIADTFRTLLPEGSPADFQRILDLKGLKKPEQQSLVDSLTQKLGPSTPPAGFKSSSTLSSVGNASFSSAASTALATQQAGAAGATAAAAAAAAGMLTSAANRDAMIARAAALGRGAMAQSAAAAAAVSQTGALKRIFALAETGGSKKDTTLRRLFNT